ncbi:F-box/LRR-repeat protein 18 isoform X2 [Hyperolius riggenbachi]|uniref:F-box/LRR-repeat protein 18 isoform X2 n=1 Tax=Hyperolius riggenbachi TaxID=752182 RepID=UPI0035A2D2E5
MAQIAEKIEGCCFNPTDLSDEILLQILSYIPSTDLILNVRKTCQKFANLCVDKSLTHRVILHKVYQAHDEQVKQMLKLIRKDISELDISGCYWLSSPTVDVLSSCKKLTRLDMAGCSVTSLRLSKILSDLHHLRSLSVDINTGFDAGKLSSECKATLSHLEELKQTVFVPSYGVVPCCTSLQRLLLYFEVLDRTREGTVMSGQLMVGESNVPHYQNLRLFYARLAPGYINEEVVRLYLAVLSDRTPENLRSFLISMPGSLLESRATKNLLESMANNVSLEAFQLPKYWMNGSSLLQHMKFSCPSYLNFSGCMISGEQLTQRILNGGKDCKSLISLNLKGCAFCFIPNSTSRKPEDDIHSTVLDNLISACSNLVHLNLSSAHHHSSETSGKHLCEILSQLKHLRFLSLPVCAVAYDCIGQSTPSAAPLAFGKKVRVGMKTYPKTPNEENALKQTSVIWKLLKATPALKDLELIGSNFFSVMPRNDPAIRNTYPPCKRSHNVGDAEVAAISQLRFLQKLTLAQIPGIVAGSSLVNIGISCLQLRTLSLANIGMMGKVTYLPSLCDMLAHCKCLKDLRLEQPYFPANERFFLALSHCSRLQRLCIVSRNGNIEAEALLSCLHKCKDVVMCHIFTGETLTSCKSLQQGIIQRFSSERPALNVVIFPLLHENLADVIRDVPMIHLDEITLFKSRVAEEPPDLWH